MGPATIELSFFKESALLSLKLYNTNHCAFTFIAFVRLLYVVVKFYILPYETIIALQTYNVQKSYYAAINSRLLLKY